MLTFKMKTNNAAFEPDKGNEAGRILMELAERLRNGEVSGKIRDYNGNTVGEFRLT